MLHFKQSHSIIQIAAQGFLHTVEIMIGSIMRGTQKHFFGLQQVKKKPAGRKGSPMLLNVLSGQLGHKEGF